MFNFKLYVMLKVLLFVVFVVALFGLFYYLWQVLCMHRRGGILKSYQVIIDYLLGLDKRLAVVKASNFSVTIAIPSSMQQGGGGSSRIVEREELGVSGGQISLF